MNKRVLFILLPLVIAFALLSGIYWAAKPHLTKFLLVQIDRLSQEKLPIALKIEGLDWNLLFPEITVTGVQIRQKPGGLKDIPDISFEKISASLDILSLAGGHIAVSSLVFTHPKTNLPIDSYLTSTGDPNAPLPIPELFALMKDVRISRLGIRSAELNLPSEKFKSSLHLGAADILLLNQKDKLILQFDLNESTLHHQPGSAKKSLDLPFRLQGDLILTAKDLDIANLKLTALNSFFTVSGIVSDLPTVVQNPQGALKFDLYSDLVQLTTAAQSITPTPNMSGTLRSSGRIEIDKKGAISAGFRMMAQKTQVDKIQIGDVQFEGNFADNTLKISDLALTNEAGLVDLRKLELGFERHDGHQAMNVKGLIQTDQLDLNELLLRLGLGDLPLEALLSGKFQCEGPVLPTPQVHCVGNLRGDQLEVRSGNKYDDTIALIDEMAADGEFSLSSKEVSYKANLKMKEDQGSSQGTVDFEKGFNIQFASPDLHFSNVRRLAGLKIEGHSQIQGSTEGDSHRATFTMKMDGKDLFFEDFQLGNTTGVITYEKGTLHFNDLNGTLGTSKYLAQVDVDLQKNRISADGQFIQFDIPEFLTIFNRRFTMPVEMSGGGTMKFKVSGPFQLGALSYDLEASLFRGSAAGESFDRVDVSLHSEAGEMLVKNATLTKNKSTIHLRGQSHPNGDVDLVIKGQDLPLEESENISKLGSQISGLLDFQMNLKGFVLHPDTQLSGRIHQLSVEEQEFQDSSFETNLSRQSVEGKTSMFGKQLVADFNFPLNENAPFLLKAQAQNWNYTTLFALIGGGSLLNDYKASLSGDIDLSSSHGGMWSSTGHALIQNISLQRGNLSLKNKLPMRITAQNGLISLENFRIEGEQTFFEVTGNGFSKNDFSTRIEGQAQMRLFQIFLPFLEDLAGLTKISVNTGGTLEKPGILGTANIEGGFVKMKGFPHPIEKLKAHVDFSQSKILIDQFGGSLAGGLFQGNGSIQIEGPHNLPVNIKARLENVNFNVPNQVRTNGDADLTFSGNWFPFILSGTYYVHGGFVDKELTDDNAALNLKQSSYLPKAILQSAFEPILLDINVILDKPLIVKNSMVDGTVVGNLQIHGAPTQPILGGKISAENGSKIVFKDKSFDVLTANVQFNNSVEINPDLYVSARSRIGDYDVNVLVQGTGKNPLVRMSSTPPLSEQDIVSLIALGVPTQRYDKQGAPDQQEQFSGLAAGVLTQIQPVKKLQQSAGVEIQFSSSYDDKQVAVQKVTISKKISDKVRASASRITGKTTSQEYALKYSLTDNISAIGRYESRQPNENSNNIDGTSKDSQSIFGLDLDFKREFK